VLLNVRGFYDGLIAFLDEVVERGFLKNAHRSMLIVAQEPMELIERLRAYEPPAVPKWITVGKR
jgi:predicted Rossmann-fold nucleotide-binding protein